MGDKTGISWTDSTWNPIRGCSRVSQGCVNCYAETMARRFSGPGAPYEGLVDHNGRWNGIVRVVDATMDQPLRWKRPRRIFTNSMSDLFHKNLPMEAIARVFAVMGLAHWHTFQVLSKRSERMRGVVNDPAFRDLVNLAAGHIIAAESLPWPLPNVHLGVSVENQHVIDRVRDLVETPAALRFLSLEPLIGPVDLTFGCDRGGFPGTYDALLGTWWPAVGDADEESIGRVEGLGRVSWVISGGESGPGARPAHPDWFRSLRDQCADAGVPFFHKQNGEWSDDPAHLATGTQPVGRLRPDGVWDNTYGKPDGVYLRRVGKKAAGCLLDGVEHKAFPQVKLWGEP